MDPKTKQDVKYKTSSIIDAMSDKMNIGTTKLKGDDSAGLDVAVVKATNSDEVVPKEKHVVTLRRACGQGSGMRTQHVIAQLLQRIESHKGKWLVTLKTLVTFHRLLREANPGFAGELLMYAERTGPRRMLRLDTFADHTTKETWDYSAWIRVYSVYLDERLDVFRVMQFDPSQDESAPTKLKDCPTGELLEKMPLAHKLLHRLVACVPEGAASQSPVVVQACGLVLREVRAVYRLVSEAVMNLCDKFFEMDRTEASQALELYKENVALNDRLNGFFTAINIVGTMRGAVQFPTLQSLPADFVTTMEEYVKDAPRVIDPSDPSSYGKAAGGKAPADMRSSSIARQGAVTSGALAGEPGTTVKLQVGPPITDSSSPSIAPPPTDAAPAPAPEPSKDTPLLDLLGDDYPVPGPGNRGLTSPTAAAAAGVPPGALQPVDSFMQGNWMASQQPGAGAGMHAPAAVAGPAGSPGVAGPATPGQAPGGQVFPGAPAFPGTMPGASSSFSPAAPSFQQASSPAYPPAYYSPPGAPGAFPAYLGAPPQYTGAPTPYPGAPAPYPGGPAPGPYAQAGAAPYPGAPAGQGMPPYGGAGGPYPGAPAPYPGPNPYAAPAPSNPFSTGGFGVPVAGANPFVSPGSAPAAAPAPAPSAAPAWDPNHDPLSNLSMEILGKPSGYVPPQPTLKQLGQAKQQG